MEKFVDQFSDKLGQQIFKRAREVSRFRNSDVDETTLGKPGHIVSPQRTSLVYPQHSHSVSAWPQAMLKSALLSSSKAPSRAAMVRALKNPATQKCMKEAGHVMAIP